MRQYQENDLRDVNIQTGDNEQSRPGLLKLL